MGDRYFDLGNLSVNNGFNEADDEWLLECLLGRAVHAPAARGAAADADHVGLPRGDVGRRAAGDVRARLRLRRATPQEHFERVRARLRRPALRRLARGRAAWRVSSRSRARCVIVGGGVGGASIAYHLAQLGWQDVVLRGPQPAHLAARRSTPPGWSASCAARCSLTRMMMDSVELYRTLDCGWVECGGLRLASLAGALGGDAPPGRLGEDVRAAARADLAPRRRRSASR